MSAGEDAGFVNLGRHDTSDSVTKNKRSLHRTKSNLGGPITAQAKTVTYAGPSINFPFALEDPLLGWVTDAVCALQSVGCGALDIYNVMSSIEKCIEEHRVSPVNSKVSRHLGSSKFWTNLPLREAFKRMDNKYRITKRRHVPVSIHEIRQTFNLAQVLVSARNLRLLSFDGDETLYRNGACFDDKELADLLISIIKHDCYVVVVTAAAYGQESEQYEARLKGLLSAMKTAELSPRELSYFLLFGGETNYLFRMTEDYHLTCVPYNEWEEYSPIGFTRERDLEAATELLDVAEDALRRAVIDLGLRTRLIRKERAVGIVPGGLRGLEMVPDGSGAKTLRPEILEEAVARVREAVRLSGSEIPYCAFNGGQDVWVDVGNKAMALEILQNMFKIHPAECMHVGDQFTESGNDITVRQQSPCIWIMNPKETKAILRRLTREFKRKEFEDDVFDDSGPDI
eukprot:Gregarina_sp_Pseudo_9__635@NODE_1404_length_1629_cov_10_464780_g1306_i0_p1_GENE_NODE_1404_length_1629_cov_10_464780_g1306_i0NODE_1404_length_1629_cov_10_464780_g1306_i0_p1_ORF_typecomplete_len467_score96_15ISN1/PF06437_11/1_1e105PMM/PF03332_13/0_00017Hydrolase_3/PF08282_12/2_2e02Hydrolase_3/PF08282_12/0_032Sof1/PF04158_14/0_074MraZ/PF02381_18/3_3e02MraZ/PF02381_18/1_1_NODE_1404_length_1629_cov_10_464780_g1306_i0361403